MRLLTLALLLTALSVSAAAQTSDPTPGYFAGAGMGFSRTAEPQIAGGLIAGVRPARTDNTWMVLKYHNITGETSTVTGNILHVLARRNNLSLLGIGGVGGATNDGNLLAAFSGGGGMAYDLGGLWRKIGGLSVSVVVEATKITGSNPEINRVRLQFSTWITQSF